MNIVKINWMTRTKTKLKKLLALRVRIKVSVYSKLDRPDKVASAYYDPKEFRRPR